MSFGLKTFSASGSVQLDTDKGGFLYLDHFILPWNYVFTRDYPNVSGNIMFTITRSQLSDYSNGATPSVSISINNGVPRISSTPIGNPLYDDASGFIVIVYARPIPNASNSFGLEVTSSKDGTLLIAESAKQLRFLGILSIVDSSHTYSGGLSQLWYSLNPVGLVPSGSRVPIMFIELRAGYYVSINKLFDFRVYGAGDQWQVGVRATPGFIPRIFVFTHDTSTIPVTDSAFGLAVYNSAGVEIFHTGRNVRYCQITNLEDITVPAFAGSQAISFSNAPPMNAAAAYMPGTLQTSGSNLYETAMTVSSSGVTVGWFYTTPAQPSRSEGLVTHKVSFIDFSLYL